MKKENYDLIDTRTEENSRQENKRTLPIKYANNEIYLYIESCNMRLKVLMSVRLSHGSQEGEF